PDGRGEFRLTRRESQNFGVGGGDASKCAIKHVAGNAAIQCRGAELAYPTLELCVSNCSSCRQAQRQRETQRAAGVDEAACHHARDHPCLLFAWLAHSSVIRVRKVFTLTLT